MQARCLCIKKMKKFFVILFSLGMFCGLHAQQANDPVIFEINGKKIYKSEFMREFLRSVGKDPNAAPTACTYEKRQALEEYVDLFVNFRTKLEDAYAMGLDTTESLRNELKGYRDELAAPYLIDSVTMMNILHEAYERNQYVLSAAHILVRVKKNAVPEDTLKGYELAMKYYERVVAGEDFNKVAQEATSEYFKDSPIPEDDPRRKDNGELGNFTVFDMVYPFECAAYSLKPGEISKPVRTNFGYHIIKLYSKTPYFGKSTFQHIWCSIAKDSVNAEKKIREAYSSMVNDGASFNSACRNYSDDNRTNNNGGLISDIAANQIPPEYITVLAKLKPGEMSEPFKTDFGWHILLKVKTETLPDFEDMVPYYKQRMTRDLRSKEPRASFVKQSKERYGFVDYTKTYTKEPKVKGKKQKEVPMATLDECVAAINDSVLNKQWTYRPGLVTDLRPLFRIGDKEYNAEDLLKYVGENQHAEMMQDLRVYINGRYDNFIADKVCAYADEHLEEQNAEFAALVDEYRKGLMIFAYNDMMVWSKATKDTVGFEEFYKRASLEHNIDNEEDAPYFWNERARVTVVTVEDSSIIKPSKVLKLLQKATKNNWSRSQLSEAIHLKMNSEKGCKVEEKVVEKEHQNLLGNNQWRVGVYEQPLPQGYRIVRVDGMIAPGLKSQTEARGYYVNDYQTYLDKQLIEKLRAKYHVIIHQNVIDEITY